MIICSLQATSSDYFWFGSMISEHPHSGMVGILWEGREITPNTLPTSQSNGHALVCNWGSGPRTASSPLESPLSFPSCCSHTPGTHSTSWVLYFWLYLLCNLPTRSQSNKFLFQFSMKAAEPCWRQMTLDATRFQSLASVLSRRLKMPSAIILYLKPNDDYFEPVSL